MLLQGVESGGWSEGGKGEGATSNRPRSAYAQPNGWAWPTLCW